MIRKIRIKNYKSLKNVEINLGNLTVIIGPNAAGKSNLFDALNLLSRLITKKNLKEAFEGHRGHPLEAVHYSSGTIADLQSSETHTISFLIDVELSQSVIRDVESRIRELRKGIDDSGSVNLEKSRITHKFLRYELELQVISSSGQMRVVNERLAALRKDGTTEKARNPFVEKVGSRLSLRMEGQAHPTLHELGLDYTIVSTPLYPPHYPHLVAFKEEMSRCFFYYLEPRVLMREANAIADVTHLGPRGEDLAAFYYTLSQRSPKQFEAIKLAAKQILPRLKNIDIEKTQKAELYLRIWEDDGSYSNRLISEGSLRVLGLLAVLSPTSMATTIGYEEPENGVHPHRLSKIADLIRNASRSGRQIIINTHSPILPTFFENKELLICKKMKSDTEFIPFSTLGGLFKKSEIEKHLEEQIIRGDFGG